MENTQANQVAAPQQTESVSMSNDYPSRQWHKSTIDVVTRIEGKQNKVAETPVYLPSLDMVYSGFPAPDKLEQDEAGNVVGIIYNNEALQYIQDALTQKVQGAVRSAIQWNKSGDVPEYTGQSREAAQDWDTLLESANTGAYFATRKEWLTKFKAYLAASQLKEQGQNQLYSMILTEKGLSNQPKQVRDAIGRHIINFVESMGPGAADVASYTNKVVSYLENGIDDVQDFAFL